MIGLRKDMENPGQAKWEYDPEETAVLERVEGQGPGYDPEETAAEKETAAEMEAAGEGEPGMPEELNGAGVFHFDGMEFRTPSELALYFQTYADDSRRSLSRKVRQLYADKEHLVPEFEAWLIAIGKEKELNAWKRKIPGTR